MSHAYPRCTESLDRLFIGYISEPVGKRLAGTSTLSQIAQIVSNLEHFQGACTELEKSFPNFRYVIHEVPFSALCTSISLAVDNVVELVISTLEVHSRRR